MANHEQPHKGNDKPKAQPANGSEFKGIFAPTSDLEFKNILKKGAALAGLNQVQRAFMGMDVGKQLNTLSKKEPAAFKKLQEMSLTPL